MRLFHKEIFFPTFLFYFGKKKKKNSREGGWKYLMNHDIVS